MIDAFNLIVDDNYKRLDSIKRVYAVVKKLIPNTDSAKVKVKIRDIKNEDYHPNEEEPVEDDPDEKNWLSLLNKTGERLAVGDAVWVYYWNTITDGYVAVKVGSHSNSSFNVKLERAMTINNDNTTLNQLSDSQESFEIRNKTMWGYNTTPDVIYVSGCPAVYYRNLSNVIDVLPAGFRTNSSSTIRRQINNFRTFINGLSSSLFVSRVNHMYTFNTVRGFINNNGTKTLVNTNCCSFKLVCRSGQRVPDNQAAAIPYEFLYTPAIYYKPERDDDDGVWNVCQNMGWYTETVGYYNNNNIYSIGNGLNTNNSWYTDTDTCAHAWNGGLIFVYDTAVFYDNATPYGYLRGRWVMKCFGTGYGTQPISGGVEPIEGDIIWAPMLYNSSRSQQGNLYNFSPMFASNDEREYARQVISRSESLPY